MVSTQNPFNPFQVFYKLSFYFIESFAIWDVVEMTLFPADRNGTKIMEGFIA
jgi:hypothetical protein